MIYRTFQEKAEDVSMRLSKLAKRKSLGLTVSEQATLSELAKFVTSLPEVLEKGGTLDYKQVRIVETLGNALDMMDKDGVVKPAEVKKLIAISADLVITEEEMSELEKDGENG